MSFIKLMIRYLERDTFFNPNFKRISGKMKWVKSQYLKTSITQAKVIGGKAMTCQYCRELSGIHNSGGPAYPVPNYMKTYLSETAPIYQLQVIAWNLYHMIS